jgi:uncharacterized protein with GYD domain
MPKYLIQANYTLEGGRGVAKEGASGRRAAIEKLVGSMGGKLEAMYYAFGNTDVYCILDMPDNVSVAAASMAVNLGGGATARTTVLLTVEEVDAAVKRLPEYRAPGR